MPQKQTSTTNSSQTMNPWDQQVPYLTQAFSDAQNAYKTGAGNLYSGPQVAQFTPDQLNTFNSMVGYGGNTAPAANLTNAGGSLTTTGLSGITDTLNRLGGFKPSGGTDSNIAAAGQYADNPYISGQVTAAMRDANNNANENVLPAIARNAAATGDINSNRTAIQQGIVQRGLAQQAGDISANLRGQAYGQGLDLAERNSEFGNNAMLQALQGAGGLASGAASIGAGDTTGGINAAGSLFNMANVGGAGQQTAGQTAIDNAKATSEYTPDRLMQLLQGEFGITGARSWGGTSTGNSTTDSSTTASPFSVIGGLMGAAGGMMMPGFGRTSAAGNLYSLFNGGTFK